jgi:hypothetical protein
LLNIAAFCCYATINVFFHATPPTCAYSSYDCDAFSSSPARLRKGRRGPCPALPSCPVRLFLWQCHEVHLG